MGRKKIPSPSYVLTNIKKTFRELNNNNLSIYDTKFGGKLWKNNCKALKVAGIIKLALDAGKANPAPPVGPALGAKGLNIMAFCKEYNAMTAKEKGSANPKKTVGSITMEQVEKIAKTKLVDLNCTCVESAVRSIIGTCKNMGVEVTA